jgi:hypothetical protein
VFAPVDVRFWIRLNPDHLTDACMKPPGSGGPAAPKPNPFARAARLMIPHSSKDAGAPATIG